jgi:peptide/nickel transport system substrate-binding protein
MNSLTSACGSHRFLRWMTALTGLLLVGCSAPAATSNSQPQGQSQAAPRAPSGPKVLKLAWDREVPTFYAGSGGAAREIRDIFSAGLTYRDAAGLNQPKLAVKVPSIADGDWKVAPDGSMEVTYQLQPGLTWHDGAPLTSEDFVFTYKLFKDPGSTFVVPTNIRQIGEVLAPSPQTIVFRYPKSFNGADVSGPDEFPPVPRHLLESHYNEVGAEGATKLPFWQTGWVGLGPFKMVKYELASFIEADAFDGFVWGRPKIDKLIIKYVLDTNALLAQTLAGEVDVLPIGSFDPQHAEVLKDQWAPERKGTVTGFLARVRQYQWQFRDPSVPWTDFRVRQAMLLGIDRQAIAEGIYRGITQVAHTVVLPKEPLYARLEQAGLRKYPYDRTEAERLLDSAGWTRGSDGIRRNAAGAELKHMPSTVGSKADELVVIAENWKTLGLRTEAFIFPTSAANEPELRAKSDSTGRNGQWDSSYWNRYLRAEIAVEPRYAGANTGGYVNPVVEDLYQRWIGALEPNARMDIEANFHKLLIDELAYLPVVYDFELFAYRSNVNGPTPPGFEGGNTTWNVHTWTLE